jgi:hypothetical protein
MKSFAEIQAELAIEHAARDEKNRETTRRAAPTKFRRTTNKNRVCPRCGTYCYGDCQAN